MLPGSGDLRRGRADPSATVLGSRLEKLPARKAAVGNGAEERLRLADALAFVIGKEEQLVLAVEQLRHALPDRPTLNPNWFSLNGGIGFVARIEEVLGVESGVAQELVSRAVELIRARLVDDVDDSLAAAERRRGRTRLHLEFLDRIDRREKDQHAGIGIDAVDSVDDVRHVFDRRAVDHCAVGSAAAGVSEQARGSADARQYAGRKLHQLREVARVQRQVADLAPMAAPGRSRTTPSRSRRRSPTR